LIVALGYLAFHPARRGGRLDGSTTRLGQTLPVPRDLLPLLKGLQPSMGKGDGSGHDQLPTNSAPLPPRSSIQLVKPMIPLVQHAEAPIPPTLLDPTAPPILTPMENVGVPGTKERNDSSGKGRGHTMGDGDKDGESIGPKDGDLAGSDEIAGISRPRVVWVKCAYCPNPEYTEEGRKQKVQGSVLLQVLVGTDGRAGRIRVARGLGLGLDDRAIETVRGWKFTPARDGSGKAVATWITVEAIYRLF
jgi:periplasmic protein TonB